MSEFSHISIFFSLLLLRMAEERNIYKWITKCSCKFASEKRWKILLNFIRWTFPFRYSHSRLIKSWKLMNATFLLLISHERSLNSVCVEEKSFDVFFLLRWELTVMWLKFESNWVRRNRWSCFYAAAWAPLTYTNNLRQSDAFEGVQGESLTTPIQRLL